MLNLDCLHSIRVKGQILRPGLLTSNRTHIVCLNKYKLITVAISSIHPYGVVRNRLT